MKYRKNGEKAKSVAFRDAGKGCHCAKWATLHPVSLASLATFPYWSMTLIIIDMCVVESHDTQKSLERS